MTATSYPATGISDRNFPSGAKVTKLDTKRQRRTKADMANIRRAIFEFCEANQPVTARQVFYNMVTRGLVGKNENEYTDTVVRLLTDMRMKWFDEYFVDGYWDADEIPKKDAIPMDWIADASRWKHEATTYPSLDSAMNSLATKYRRSYWDGAKHYVELWLEKEALAGVMETVTREYAVPLMPAHGYSSVTFLWKAAEDIKNFWADKPAYIYLFGDRDPSGVDAHRDIEAKLRKFAPDVDWHFQRVAVTKRQIEEWNLPSRPTKKSDPRSKNFKGESVELDALPPDTLRRLTREAIEKHVDKEKLQELKRREEAEKAVLATGATVLSRVKVL
jgi:hypothetical protein